MATATALLSSSKPIIPGRTLCSSLSSPCVRTHSTLLTQSSKPPVIHDPKPLLALVGAGLAFALTEPASATVLPLLGSLQLSEPANALSLPTWAIHVSSVVEWITAMALVWQYGEKSGFESWKGLSWGMVPLLGGAFCACTWHFFYNSESLEMWSGNQD